MKNIDYNKIVELVNKCKDHYTFEFEGLLIDGEKVDIIKRYLKINPSKSFRTWLIDFELVIKEL